MHKCVMMSSDLHPREGTQRTSVRPSVFVYAHAHTQVCMTLLYACRHIYIHANTQGDEAPGSAAKLPWHVSAEPMSLMLPVSIAVMQCLSGMAHFVEV
jgi:hypothetical protein